MTPEMAMIALSFLFGLVIGSFLNVVSHRVPVGASLLDPSHCPRCEAPIRPWQNIPVLSWLALRGKCAACRQPISVRYPLVELTTGVLFASIAWLLPWQQLAPNTAAAICILLAYWWFAGSSVALTLIDLDTKRLPDVIVLPGYAVGVGLLTLACLLGADWWALLRAGIGAAVLFGVYALLWLARPGAMGAGDVKLAGLVGLHLGWLGWAAVAVGAIAAFILGGLYGVGLLAARRAGRKTALAFGPWMIAGAWTGALAGTAIAQFYLGISGLV
ncbi:MAG: prepilin peptidase [Actinobacteria bacterium]|nr:prepilin peptidase [Actinomycetota bacterium]